LIGYDRLSDLISFNPLSDLIGQKVIGPGSGFNGLSLYTENTRTLALYHVHTHTLPALTMSDRIPAATIINLPLVPPAHQLESVLTSKAFKKADLQALAKSWGVKAYDGTSISRLNKAPLVKAILLAQTLASEGANPCEDKSKETKATLVAECVRRGIKASLSDTKEVLLAKLAGGADADEKEPLESEKAEFEADKRSMTRERLVALIRAKDGYANFDGKKILKPQLQEIVCQLYEGWKRPSKEAKPVTIAQPGALSWMAFLKDAGTSLAAFVKMTEEEKTAIRWLYEAQKKAPVKEEKKDE
jgi:hypothetical protein